MRTLRRRPVLNATSEWIRRGLPFKTVPAARIYTIAHQVLNPTSFGFVAVRNGFYVRPVGDNTFHVLKLTAWKGATYSVRWGVSLSFVPHEWRSGLRFHRTLKSAHHDLFEEAPEESIRAGGTWNEALASVNHGEDHFREELFRIWAWARPLAEDWWASVQLPDDALAMAEHQMRRPDLGLARHWPPPWLVEAFCLARLGDRSRAEAALQAGLAPEESSLEFPPEAKALLTQGLVHVSRTGS